ncbi:outer membrane protein assembly factor BamA [Cochlodiniinecator piscidefendens]|uniref:outer membrane protein assembly factor BamA n=1 Tax=Cochlodiniinecator piscidefendens TaxID=2715756 RepID=UPI001E636B12|nr:outer membrane protein assembly factor BamA [Cochlodiniinecator piscidefendens]
MTAIRSKVLHRKLGLKAHLRMGVTAVFCVMSTAYVYAPQPVIAQQYTFNTVEITGNQRIEAATILSYIGIARGERVSAAQLNDGYQRLIESGLFENVELIPQGGRLVINVVELPTVNRINIEGNNRIDDDALLPLLRSAPRRVFNATIAEDDAARITQAYVQSGRLAATVEPRIIRRSDNRVDLVFEVTEGRTVEIERLNFVGNRAYSDRRLRNVLQTKQAGIFRQILSSDTFIADRLEFDRQVLSDFYSSRGYIDFEIQSVNSELSRERDGFFITFNIREGQQFSFGEITTSSNLPEVDIDQFQEALRTRSGSTYSPIEVENSISRLEALALQLGLNFIRIEPRISRNDRDLTLDVEYVLSRGPRVFVERIDIEGNTTTLDRVVRNQFRSVEGDPFNPREIRDAAERIRAIGFFSNAEVNAREGSSPDQVLVDVNVEEQPTGSLSFGASYSQDDGVGVNVGFSERNFLGRGQSIGFNVSTASSDQSFEFNFAEPNLLGRDLRAGIQLSYDTSENSNSDYSSRISRISPTLSFPVGERSRLQLRYALQNASVFDVDVGAAIPSRILRAEEALDDLWTSSIGATYSFDSRATGLSPDSGVVLRFGADIGGLGGDREFVKLNAAIGGETRIFNGDVALRAEFEAGALHMISGNSTITERFRIGSRLLRGFEANGIGPRDLGATNQNALGGNFFAVARFEADFPIGIPEEYGVRGGLFLDVGSLWGLDNTEGAVAGTFVDDSANLRAVVGFSIFWETQLGPLRFNFSHPLKQEDYDRDRSFDLTISTTF